MNHYGIIFDRFWSGPTGSAIRDQGGPHAQLVALHLMTCEYANMLGLYFLPVDRIVGDTGLTRRALGSAFAVLGAADFADYDVRSQHVWVKQMAVFRIPLKPGVDRLEKTDNRAIAAARVYTALSENPFLGPFFDRYGSRLRLVGRRTSAYQISGFEGSPKGVRTPFEASKQIQDQDQVRTSTGARRRNFHTPVENATPTHGQLCVIVKEVVAADPKGGYDDLLEAIKVRCAGLHFLYTGDGIRKAYDAVEHAARRAQA